MTDREILANAIDKAIANGWDWKTADKWLRDNIDLKGIDTIGIIFSHSFAKAFWGEKEEYYLEYNLYEAIDKPVENIRKKSPIWEYHLQQMVLEENPIKYLERFL